jgi:predicted transcriptional regulator
MPDINRKLQKLASAIYLITSFFDGQEPLRWRLRSSSADLVSDTIKDKISVVKEIGSLLLLAKSGGLVSDTNHEILIQELSKVENEQEKPLDIMYYRGVDSIGTIERSTPALSRPKSIKDKNTKDMSLKKNSRQSIILEVLKSKKEAMIKDISSLVEGCSEKTIQRELISMMRAGMIRKTGERRWSRYSLVG